MRRDRRLRDEAEKELLKLIEAYPDEVRFYGLLAEMYSSGNQDEKAIETYEKLFELDPNNALGQLSIIEFYKRKNDSENLLLSPLTSIPTSSRRMSTGRVRTNC